ncbi:hypothetical protein AB2T90_11130 [Clostridium butyricum]|uniref:hypothetical protein n=1 Tax=Clostridium butyricum TaxID=1492 RepID=UPI003467C9F2
MENINDGCGLISSKILNNKFEGFKNNTIYILKDNEGYIEGVIPKTIIQNIIKR